MGPLALLLAQMVLARLLSCRIFIDLTWSLWGKDSSEECLTEKWGAMLTQVRVSGATRDFSPNADSYSLSTAPKCFHMMHASTTVHALKVPNTGSGRPCLDTQKCCRQ